MSEARWHHGVSLALQLDLSSTSETIRLHALTKLRRTLMATKELAGERLPGRV
jgi:hypothetical protein